MAYETALPPVLAGDNITLRRTEPSMADEAFALWCESPRRLRPVKSLLTTEDEVSREAVRHRFSLLDKLWGDMFTYGIIVDSGAYGGHCGVLPPAANGEAELFYWLGEKFQGRHLATSSVAMLCGALAESRASGQADLYITWNNWPSRRVAKACGFTYAGTLRSPFSTTAVQYSKALGAFER
ncbi:hypothetical protein FACS1894186_5680 [Alphaproteobacteria bacterium]|nr:hypothetical protein FACS1894186_5680 [Alphaproteobacteria bacterium]